MTCMAAVAAKLKDCAEVVVMKPLALAAYTLKLIVPLAHSAGS